MDNLFEIIVPLIFAAIYFFGNMLSGKSDDASAPAPHREEDPDAVERQRRIQEEIRRKIMERRNAEGQGASPASEPASEVDRSLRERHAALEERRRQREMTRRAEASKKRTEPASRIPHPTPQEPAFGGAQSDEVYSTQMQARLWQIEATKRQAERLTKQAAERASSLRPQPSHSSLSTSRAPLARGSVRRTLCDPATARAAFIYSEVLGTPVSQKKTSTVPGLAQG